MKEWPHASWCVQQIVVWEKSALESHSWLIDICSLFVCRLYLWKKDLGSCILVIPTELIHLTAQASVVHHILEVCSVIGSLEQPRSSPQKLILQDQKRTFMQQIHASSMWFSPWTTRIMIQDKVRCDHHAQRLQDQLAYMKALYFGSIQALQLLGFSSLWSKLACFCSFMLAWILMMSPNQPSLQECFKGTSVL